MGKIIKPEPNVCYIIKSFDMGLFTKNENVGVFIYESDAVRYCKEHNENYNSMGVYYSWVRVPLFRFSNKEDKKQDEKG